MSALINYKLKKKCTCKKCGYLLDAALGDHERAPVKDDINICGNCGTVSKYTRRLNIKPLSDKELNAIKQDYPEKYTQIMTLVSLIKNKL